MASLLYFWVRGSKFSDIETIKVPEDTTIADLQSQIETELHLLLDSVHLYTVPETTPVDFSDRHGYTEVLGKLSISELSVLFVFQTVAEIRPLREHHRSSYHHPRSVPVVCYRRGGSTDEKFTMYLQGNALFRGVIDEPQSHWAEHLGNNEWNSRIYKLSSQEDSEMAEILMKEGEGDHITARYQVNRLSHIIPFSEGQMLVIEKVSLEVPNLIHLVAASIDQGSEKHTESVST